MKRYYRICPECGAHLDPSEHCDCVKTKESVRAVAAAQDANKKKNLTSDIIPENMATGKGENARQ